MCKRSWRSTVPRTHMISRHLSHAPCFTNYLRPEKCHACFREHNLAITLVVSCTKGKVQVLSMPSASPSFEVSFHPLCYILRNTKSLHKNVRTRSLTSTANAAIRQFVDDDVAVAASNEEHILPRHYTEEEKVSLAVTRLAENEQLLQALAWRLGIPLADIRPNGREPALSRKGSHTKPDGEEGENSSENDEEKEENREQIEVLDAWGCSVGDVLPIHGGTPKYHSSGCAP